MLLHTLLETFEPHPHGGNSALAASEHQRSALFLGTGEPIRRELHKQLRVLPLCEMKQEFRTSSSAFIGDVLNLVVPQTFPSPAESKLDESGHRVELLARNCSFAISFVATLPVATLTSLSAVESRRQFMAVEVDAIGTAGTAMIRSSAAVGAHLAGSCVDVDSRELRCHLRDGGSFTCGERGGAGRSSVRISVRIFVIHDSGR